MDKIQLRLNMAKEISKMSKDPSTQVGCIITNKNNRIISEGYNGFIAGCDETLMSNDRPLKYELYIHAEMNAILYAKQDLSNCIAYITHSPCGNCLKHLLQAGIKEIYYSDCSIVRDRGTDLEKEGIVRLISSIFYLNDKYYEGLTKSQKMYLQMKPVVMNWTIKTHYIQDLDLIAKIGLD